MKKLIFIAFAAFSVMPVKAADTAAIGDQWKIQAKSDLSQAAYLFVIHAADGYIKDDTLFLNNAGPSTLYFSDRPYRLAGHLGTDTFLAAWKKGSDSFEANPPNVVISFQKAGKPVDITVEIAEPQFDGSDLKFRIIRVLQEDKAIAPGKKFKFKHPSLFIDGYGCWVFGC
ncbi:MAG: hypothetical protein CVU79_03630 [Elusimicrobia bacterium HGW-Elusimicrobia-3]|nr:MAG: hypothetical protein CVU79_03630 [Elusimicrobia bacterium HGW-Elusimicrobia-3]